MLIDRILHVRSSGSVMDFYNPSYFSAEHVDLRLFAESRQLFAYCTYLEDRPGRYPRTVRKVIDLSTYLKDHPEWDWRESLEIDTEYQGVDNPVVPPSLVRVSSMERVKETKWMDYCLRLYNDCTPKYISPHQNKLCTGIELNVPTEEGEVSGLGVRFSFAPAISPVDTSTTLPIVNGFACWPTHSVRTVTAVEGSQYFSDRGRRDRQCVLVDFSPVGGCSFVKCSDCTGTLNEFTLPDDVTFDPSEQSLIVVIDGRILTPDDYLVRGKTVTVLTDRLDVRMELDRLVCCGELYLKDKSVVTADGTRDLFNQTNSFVIIVNRSNMQIVAHREWTQVDEKRPDSKTINTEDKLTFDQCARGLLYDTTTRSVHDHVREEHTSTFYADGMPGMEEWKVSTVTVNHERPLVILGGTRSNFMSAKAMMFDKPNEFCHDDSVRHPRFVLLDFIFRG